MKICVNCPYQIAILVLHTLFLFFKLDKSCTNKRTDCHEYGKEMCRAPYEAWAKENCAQYCDLCGPG